MLDQKYINSYDGSNMYDAIKDMHNQITDSIKIMNDFNVEIEKYNNILICGMGGSAIGGDFVRNILFGSMITEILVSFLMFIR